MPLLPPLGARVRVSGLFNNLKRFGVLGLFNSLKRFRVLGLFNNLKTLNPGAAVLPRGQLCPLGLGHPTRTPWMDLSASDPPLGPALCCAVSDMSYTPDGCRQWHCGHPRPGGSGGPGEFFGFSGQAFIIPRGDSSGEASFVGLLTFLDGIFWV